MTNGRWAYVYDPNGNVTGKGDTILIEGEAIKVKDVPDSYWKDQTLRSTSGIILTDDGGGTYYAYEYDLMNRMMSVSKNGTLLASYQYNWKGLRVKKERPAAQDGETRITYFIYSPNGKIIYEEDVVQGDATPETGDYRQYAYLFGRHFAREDGTISATGEVVVTDKVFYQTDHLGSTVAVTDTSGKVVWSNEFTPFGSLADEANKPAAGAKYTGKDYDEDACLYYSNARWYDPDTGRFTSLDPIRDGLNWYVYCGNNPVNRIDPTGLLEMDYTNPSVKPTYKITPTDANNAKYWSSGVPCTITNPAPTSTPTPSSAPQPVEPPLPQTGDSYTPRLPTKPPSGGRGGGGTPAKPVDRSAEVSRLEREWERYFNASRADSYRIGGKPPYDHNIGIPDITSPQENNSQEAGFWKPVPGYPGWWYHKDYGAGGNDPDHYQFGKGKDPGSSKFKRFLRRIKKSRSDDDDDDFTQYPHGSGGGVDKDVPEEVVKNAIKGRTIRSDYQELSTVFSGNSVIATAMTTYINRDQIGQELQNAFRITRVPSYNSVYGSFFWVWGFVFGF